MTQSTPKLGLLLYDIGTPDNQATFLQFRTDLAGVTGSNFTKIDTAIAGIDTRLTTVEGLKPIVKLDGTSTDNANYIATNANISTLYNGLLVDFIPNQDNTSTATLTINGGSIKTINKISASGTVVNLDARDLMANRRYILEYDGTEWVLINSTSADQVNVNGTPGTILVVDTDNSIGVSAISVTNDKISADNLNIDGTGIISDSGTLSLSKPLSASIVRRGVEWGTDGRAISVEDFKIEPTEIDIDASLRNNDGTLGLSLTGITAGTYKGILFDSTGRAVSGSGTIKAGEIKIYPAGRIVDNENALDLGETGITAGIYKGLTLDAYGRVTGTNNLVQANEISIDSSLKNTAGVLGVSLAPDSSKLGGQLPSYYLSTTGKAADSNKLDGLDSTDFGRPVFLTTALTSTAWDGDNKTSTDNGIIDLSAVFGVPAGVKAVLVSVQQFCNTVNAYIRLGPTSNNPNTIIVRTPAPNVYGSMTAIIPCDSNGDIYFSASSGNTISTQIWIWGYWL